MHEEVEKVLYNVLFRINRALDCIAQEECRQEVLSHLVLAAERLEVVKSLWLSMLSE